MPNLLEARTRREREQNITTEGTKHSVDVLTLSEAVAILVPGMLRVTQQSLASCAEMKRAGFSVLARSTSCTLPVSGAGKASRPFVEEGESEQMPLGLRLIITRCPICLWTR